MKKILLFWCLCFSLAALLHSQDASPQAESPQTPGATRASPQSRPQPSNSSETRLTTWERLSAKFETGLSEQGETLSAALSEIKTLQASGEKLTNLLEALSKQNESLKSLNAEIAARMQERDEDLARAYADLDKKSASARGLIVLVIAMGAALAVPVLARIIRLALKAA
jgi:Skp family chaperone for outer membrane proteins